MLRYYEPPSSLRCAKSVRVTHILHRTVQYVIMKAMGRPKNFSREGVLEKALPVFWKHGFADTSLQDLEKATGVNKSGLYAEFADKGDLYLESLRPCLRKRQEA